MKLTAEQVRGLHDYAVQMGALHEEDCPADDTCNCKWKYANDGINAACNAALSAQKEMKS